MDRSEEVIVVGAGVAGLGAAHDLTRRGHSVLVLEREPAPGGRVRTERWTGALIELGAHFVTRCYSRVLVRVEELGLRGELTPVQNAFRTAVRRHGQWHYVDYAHLLSTVHFSAIGWRDRLSLGGGAVPALARGWRLSPGDLAPAARLDSWAAADLFHSDAFRFYVSPIFEAFFSYQPSELSYAHLATALRFRARPLTLTEGLSSLTSRLARDCEVELGVAVERLQRNGQGIEIRARDAGGRARALNARVAILATTAHEAARLWADAPAHVHDFLGAVSYSRADHLYLRTKDPFAPTTDRGDELYMELIPAGERTGGMLTYLGFMNSCARSGGLLFAHAAPGSGAERLADDVLADALQAEVERLHPELRGQIVDRRVVRWEAKVPRFPQGQSRRLATFRRALEPSAIDLAGDYLYAPWIEGALRSGEAAARRVAAFLERPGRR